MKIPKLLISLLCCGIAILSAFPISAQTTTEDGTVIVEPLFTYPEAPNYINELGARADYLMDNFWKDMNFKQKVVNQSALQHAFDVYATPMRWAQAAKVQNSVKNLLKKVSKNPTLATQIMKAAEVTFHSPLSEVYIDDVYQAFLEGFINNKKIKPERKRKYVNQLKAMEATHPGNAMPALMATDVQGAVMEPVQGSEFTLYLFGSARDSQLRQLLLQLNTNLALERLCSGGNLGINYINVTPQDALSDDVINSLPKFVNGGYAPTASDVYDLRISPSVYLLDADNNIIDRNITIQQAFDEIGKRKFSTSQDTPTQ